MENSVILTPDALWRKNNSIIHNSIDFLFSLVDFLWFPKSITVKTKHEWNAELNTQKSANKSKKFNHQN